MQKDEKKIKDLNRKERLRKGKSLKFALSIPPSVNKLWDIKPNGKRVLNSHARRYLSDVRSYSLMLCEDSAWRTTGRDEWLYMDLVFYFPDKIIRDSHNFIKVLVDALQGSVFENDYSVMPRIQAVELDELMPRVEITVSHQTKSERADALKKYS